MKTTISLHDFREAFKQVRPDQFSYEALGLIFSYLEEYEMETGEEFELDVIAICCDFAESNKEEIMRSYDFQDSPEESDLMNRIYFKDWLRDETLLLGETEDGNFVYQQF